MLITHDQAFLWTDGRYWLQCEDQLVSPEWTLMKQGAEGTPTVLEWLKE